MSELMTVELRGVAPVMGDTRELQPPFLNFKCQET
jgi:hypothetical protein